MSAYALLIGLTRFSDPELAGLRAPRSDVEALKAVLADPARGGFDNVIPSIDEDLATIRDKLSALLDDRRPEDMVLLYYSGHGVVDRGNNLFLATGATCFKSPRARSLASSEVREMMQHSRAGKVVVVLDCCHSGIFTEGTKGTAEAVNAKTFDPGEGAEGYYVLTATSAIQYALDSQATQQSLSEFTSWLVDGLRSGEAAPDRPYITLDDLWSYVSRRARLSEAPMTPSRYVGRNTGEIVIARNPAAQPPSIPDDILARLDSPDWKARLDAVGALRDIVSMRGTLRSGAIKWLRAHASSERDRDVHEAMMSCLVELGGQPEDRPVAPINAAGPNAMSGSPNLGGPQLLAFTGAILSVGSAAYFMQLLIRRFVFGAEMQSVSALFAITFFLLSLILFALGLRAGEGPLPVLKKLPVFMLKVLWNPFTMSAVAIVGGLTNLFIAFVVAVSDLEETWGVGVWISSITGLGIALCGLWVKAARRKRGIVVMGHRTTWVAVWVLLWLSVMSPLLARYGTLWLHKSETITGRSSPAPESVASERSVPSMAVQSDTQQPDRSATSDASASVSRAVPVSPVRTPRQAGGSGGSPVSPTNATMEGALDIPIGSKVHQIMKAPTEIRYFRFTTADPPPAKIRVELRDLTLNNAGPQLIVTDGDEREIFNHLQQNGNIVFILKAPKANATYYAIAKQYQIWGRYGPPLAFDIVVATSDAE